MGYEAPVRLLCSFGWPWLLPLAALAFASCASDRVGTFAIVFGPETEVLTRPPAPSELIVEAVDPAGQVTPLARAALPAETIDLGNRPRGLIARFSVTGRDEGGVRRVYGSTLVLSTNELEGRTFDIFVQRTDEFARLPSELPEAPESPNLGLLGGRYVVALPSEGEADASALLYDLLAWRAVSRGPPLGRRARSLVVGLRAIIAIDESGATSMDVGTERTTEIAAQGGSFSEVAGGRTVFAPDGTAFVVGPTRSVGPSSRIFVVKPDGSTRFASLLTAREGAACVWVPERGLLVAGGSDTGSGAELLGAEASLASELPFPTDPVRGAGAAVWGTSASPIRLALVGGEDRQGTPAPTRLFDVACVAPCLPLSAPALPLPVSRPDVFTMEDGVLAVGTAPAGETLAFRLDPTLARALPFRVARRHARAFALPTGSIAVVGGDPTIESYFP